MVPVKTMQNTTVLDESARVRDLLLVAQKKVESTTQRTAADLLKDGRERLGYDMIDTADMDGLIDVRVSGKTPVITPKMAAVVLPASDNSIRTTTRSRQGITAIINHKDDRLVAVVGPCSIHDPRVALEYARACEDVEGKVRRQAGGRDARLHGKAALRAWLEGLYL